MGSKRPPTTPSFIGGVWPSALLENGACAVSAVRTSWAPRRPCEARAGDRSATAAVTVYHRQLEASGILYLVAGGTGIPFSVSGPVDKPKMTVSKGAFVGATIGAAMPSDIGIGAAVPSDTGIGARIINALGRMFSGGAPEPAAEAPDQIVH